MSFLHTLNQGQVYLKTWPSVAKLGMIFPENRVIRSTKFAQRFMPFAAVFAVVWGIFLGHGVNALAAALLTAVFALCIPLQGLYWLGKRAQKTLPVQSAVWFEKISAQLKAKGVALSQINREPTYQDLAGMLKLAEQNLDKYFWEDL